jgi:hypothetical protein
MEEEYGEKPEKIVHEHRRIKHKIFWSFLILLALFSVACLIDFMGIQTAIKKVIANQVAYWENNVKNENSSYLPLNELNNRSSSFYGKNVSVRGMLSNRLGGYSLIDKNGYWVWIEDSCLNNQTRYSYESVYYIASGTWIKPKAKEYALDPMRGTEYKERVRCLFPLYQSN